MKKLQFYLTPSEGKRLIARAIATLPQIREALQEHTVVVVSGTTNAPIAHALLQLIGEQKKFDHRNFFRGLTVPAGTEVKAEFTGDVVIQKGKWLMGKTIFDVEEALGKDDIILKGANAVNLTDREAGVLIGNPKVGTSLPILNAVYGRRAKLYIPVGAEKRVDESISALAEFVNDPDAKGLRLLPLPGEVFTELEAISTLTGAEAVLIAGGGVMGAEGGTYYMATGTEEALQALESTIQSIRGEKAFW